MATRKLSYSPTWTLSTRRTTHETQLEMNEKNQQNSIEASRHSKYCEHFVYSFHQTTVAQSPKVYKL